MTVKRMIHVWLNRRLVQLEEGSGKNDMVGCIKVRYEISTRNEKCLDNTLQRKTFEGENFRKLVKDIIFMEKTLVYSHKTVKIVKVFSLESFLLYSMSLTNCTGFHTEGEGPEILPPPRNLEIEYGYYCFVTSIKQQSGPRLHQERI